MRADAAHSLSARQSGSRQSAMPSSSLSRESEHSDIASPRTGLIEQAHRTPVAAQSSNPHLE
jgi:hypothetical protein